MSSSLTVIYCLGTGRASKDDDDDDKSDKSSGGGDSNLEEDDNDVNPDAKPGGIGKDPMRFCSGCCNNSSICCSIRSQLRHSIARWKTYKSIPFDRTKYS